MPVKKDGTGKRWVEMEFVTPGSPEQVWAAMATGPGNVAWFAQAKIEERVGGKIQFSFGADIISSGLVTFWEPPHQFGYVEIGWMEGAPPVATEITITSRAGGKCVVRMVHSLFASTDDWDDQLESFEGGWPAFFTVLKLYLANYAGETGASFQVMKSLPGADAAAVWKRLTEQLGLHGADVGERLTLPARPEALSGVVIAVHQEGKVRVVTLHLDAPTPGVAIVGTYDGGDAVRASTSLFAYGDDAPVKAAEREKIWRAWLEGALS